jgi:hypothetical protein
MRIDERSADAKAMDWDMLCIKHHGTVCLISDTEWDEIYEAYDYPEMWDRRFDHDSNYTFSQFIRELISLAGEGK